MLLFIAVVALAFYLVPSRPSGLLALSWFLCSIPIASGVIEYEYLRLSDFEYGLALAGFFAVFCVGELLWARSGRPVPREFAKGEDRWRRTFVRSQKIATFAWLAGMTGVTFVMIDFISMGGGSLADMADLRYAFILRDTSVFLQVATVLTWGCLYCLVFALSYRKELGRWRFVLFLVPTLGYFCQALFAAGRQAAFHILLVSIFTLFVNRIRVGSAVTGRDRQRGWAPSALLACLMLGYMGFIASARNDGLMSSDKTEVLQRLFNFEVSGPLLGVLQRTDPVIGAGMLEGIVYFSGSVAMFRVFLEQPLPEQSYGALTFPFAYRQLEPVTAISVTSALSMKADMMRNGGVMDVAWSTAIAHYICDFGLAGAVVFLFIQGCYSAAVWRKLKCDPDLDDVVIAVLVALAAVYTPLLPATWETSIFLLWVFCLASKASRLPEGYSGVHGPSRPG